MTKLLISNCDVLQVNGNGPQVASGMDILIDGQRITSISVHAANAEAFLDAECIDGSGMLAIPGLMNTHAHVPMVLFRGLAEIGRAHV